ncbi:MAG: SHOCT domain-containing protein [Pseudomonadota bacterium]|nr:SHOCT domain-containing protein [Pseudomonadota bacterium]
MQSLTTDGQKTVAEIAARHGVSSDAASQLLTALGAGGGRQAQFNHPELGGMGQWSQGGMIMIGDMFNNGLKARVAALCDELAQALHSSDLFVAGDAESGPGAAHHSAGRWPAELGSPSSSGSQNDMHYAVFPQTRRLAIEQQGRVTVYDTGDHRIGGISQQQSGDQTLRFTSQSGAVPLSELKIITGEPQAGGPPPVVHNEPAPSSSATPPKGAETASHDAIFSGLERLADLRSRDIITAEEFATKKAELLARL